MSRHRSKILRYLHLSRSGNWTTIPITLNSQSLSPHPAGFRPGTFCRDPSSTFSHHNSRTVVQPSRTQQAEPVIHLPGEIPGQSDSVWHKNAGGSPNIWPVPSSPKMRSQNRPQFRAEKYFETTAFRSWGPRVLYNASLQWR